MHCQFVWRDGVIGVTGRASAPQNVRRAARKNTSVVGRWSCVRPFLQPSPRLPVSFEPAPLGSQGSPADDEKTVPLSQLATRYRDDVAASKKEMKQTARQGKVGTGRVTVAATVAPPAPARLRRRAKGLVSVPTLPSTTTS